MLDATPLREPLAQRLSLEQFHDEERPALAVHAEVVDAHHVRMREAGGRARLHPEPRVQVERSGHVLSDQFHRDLPLQHAVEGEIHRAHAAASEAAIEPIAPVQLT